MKYLGQFLSALAISGHSERFSPGNLRSEVGRPEGLWLTLGPPTSEPFGPGEISTEGPEIPRPIGPNISKIIGPKIPEKFRAAYPWGT